MGLGSLTTRPSKDGERLTPYLTTQEITTVLVTHTCEEMVAASERPKKTEIYVEIRKTYDGKFLFTINVTYTLPNVFSLAQRTTESVN